MVKGFILSLAQCNPQSKMLWHIDRVAEFIATGNTAPILFEIDPSNKCNHDCPWCSFSKLRSESQDMLCLESLTNILIDLKTFGVKAINYTGGGEPLMNPSTIKAIEQGYQLDLDQGIFTNGQLLTEKKADIMAKKMTWIRFSLDAGNAVDYARSHGTSEQSFYKVLDNLRYLCSIKNRCTVGVGFIITPENYHGILDAAFFAYDCGADYIQFKPEIRRPNQPQITREFYEENILPQLRRAKNLQTDKFNVMITQYRFDDLFSPETNYGRAYKKCLSHNFQGAIGADGKVYVCDHHKGEKDYEIGDLKESSIEDIWYSVQRHQVINKLDQTDLSQCQVCCRNHEANKFLWHCLNKEESLHPNHI